MACFTIDFNGSIRDLVNNVILMSSIIPLLQGREQAFAIQQWLYLCKHHNQHHLTVNYMPRRVEVTLECFCTWAILGSWLANSIRISFSSSDKKESNNGKIFSLISLKSLCKQTSPRCFMFTNLWITNKRNWCSNIPLNGIFWCNVLCSSFDFRESDIGLECI